MDKEYTHPWFILRMSVFLGLCQILAIIKGFPVYG
jgi:hypothetical protein